ncbi:hypothetical protein [Candidatus Poriferisocius sp.]|uniref:hypothetical protein n=1 Tax=Candidatus Poriferisocius sp. TaxID=3101276 RepID=UPI003B519F4E
MPVSEAERMELVGRLTDAIGEGAAKTLMACVLPDGRDQLATKAELEVFRSESKAEFASIRAGLESLAAETRAGLESLAAETRAGLESLAAETRAGHAELRSFVESKLARQARLHYGTLATFLMSVWGVFLAQSFMM